MAGNAPAGFSPLLRAQIFQAGAPIAVQLGVAGCLIRVGGAGLMDPVAARVPVAAAGVAVLFIQRGARGWI